MTEPSQQEGCAEQPRLPPHLRGGRDARWPRPLPCARAGTGGQGRQRRRKLSAAVDGDAGLSALLANDEVEVIVGRGRWGVSWQKNVFLNDCGLSIA